MDDLISELEELSLNKPKRKTAKILANLEYRRLTLLLLQEILLELRELNNNYKK